MDAYILHRMVVAGFQGGMIFEAKALEKIHQASRGIPRLINILCHKSLLVSYGQGIRHVNLANVLLAISDTEDAQLSHTRHPWWRRFVASVAALSLVSLTSYMLAIHSL
jgi:MSHA biogenesis protein MshM